MIAPAAIVRACFAAYESKDRAAIEALIADDFTFTSPLDDHINRETYFQRCWPNSEHIDAIRIERLFVQGDEAFVQYELKSKDGAPCRNTELFVLLDGKVASVEVFFGRETGEQAREEEIKSVLDSLGEGIRSKDVDATAMLFAPDAVRYSLAPPLQSDDSFKKELSDWFSTFRGEIGCEMRDLIIEASADVACAHGLNHMTGTKTDGENVDVWFRETLCLRPMDGHWRITHAHESVPFYMDGSLKAAVDLKPAN